MTESVPSYFELSIHCQDAKGQAFYRVYTELEDWRRKLWRGPTTGQVRLMAEGTGFLDILRAKGIEPLEVPASGCIYDHAIDALIQGAEKVVTTDRTVWLVRDG
jgi:hypothetical protein